VNPKGVPLVRRGRRRSQCEGVDDDYGGHADFSDAKLVVDAGDVAAATIARDLARGATIPVGGKGGRCRGGGFVDFVSRRAIAIVADFLTRRTIAIVVYFVARCAIAIVIDVFVRRAIAIMVEVVAHRAVTIIVKVVAHQASSTMAQRLHIDDGNNAITTRATMPS
jgi:hypothetical protein